MKNLKRVLSLALSTAMVLGMMVIGSGAVAAETEKAYNNDVAVATVKVLGIMEGDENGNFNGEKVVSRNEMAVVMANLADLKLNGAHPFSDVPAWADKYVAALYTNGLTSGTSATTYGGSENITATQAALMIMKTLGYFEFQGEFGDDWALATIKKATELKMFKDIDAGVNEGLNRTELAQMIYNVLNESVVQMKETNGMKVEGNGITVTQTPEYRIDYVVEPTLLGKLIDDEGATISKLDSFPMDCDAFGRPGTVLEYDEEEIKVIRKADKVLVNTDDEITNVIDLLEDEDIEYDETCDIDIDITEGYVVELFEDIEDEDVLYDVVVYNYAAVQIDEVEECDEDDDEAWIEAGAEVKVKLVDNDLFEDEYLYDIQIAGFDAKTYVDDAWILVSNIEGYVPNDDEAIELDVDDEDEEKQAVYYGLSIAETVAGEVETTKGAKVRIDGTQYKALCDLVDEAEGENGKDLEAGDDWTLVLDANDYVVAVKLLKAAATAIEDVYVWADSYGIAGKYGKDVYAVLVDLAGEITEVKIDAEIDDDGVVTMNGDDTAAEQNLVVIDENEDDETILVAWDEKDFDVTANAITKLEKDQKRVVDDDDELIARLNAETVYVMVGGAEEDIEATVKTGGVKFTTVPGASWIITEEDEVEALYVIIVDTDEIKESASGDAFFVVELDPETSKDYFVNEVIFENGEKQSIKFADGEEEKIEDGKWYDYEIDDDGYYTIKSEVEYATFEGKTWDEEDGIVNAAEVVELYGDLLTIDSVADINVENAKFIDAHDKDDEEGGQWDKAITSLTKLCDLVEDDKVTETSIEIVIDEKDGATLIILTSAVAA